MGLNLSDQIHAGDLIVERTPQANQEMSNLQKDTDALLRLDVRGLLSEKETLIVRKRILKLVRQQIRITDPPTCCISLTHRLLSSHE